MTYLEPIQAAYRTQAYQNMETGIFPLHFHGKCLDKNGQEPAGCPNPDCPVVCGTPGSMVHFYSLLRFIAFNQTYHLLESLAAPGSPSYNRVETLVLKASQSPPPPDERRRRRVFSRFFSRDVVDAMAGTQDGSGGRSSPRDSLSGSGFVSGAGPSSGSHTGLGLPSGPGRRVSKRTQDVRAGLRSILQQIRALLLQACGGNGVDKTNGLPDCSWEAAMKEYILSFP
ncbi:hypothetical protein GSI_14563 [Ganoderma sinense ZZ0214-1]|uniref:Uncharacterized protein n=1 Tax=Ganoderma sinense ZZ0214-1 TaxID=1077348 RepID=A0A2G8RP34_9APHY|nr:hypothetical protein GSI_14563 [Ganoderma sinense ZZ0214-1]